MSLLFRIVYAAHAKGTHHKLALDALRHLRSKDAEGWTRLFLKHADLYMQGSKAPDDEFKDFKNHVLHVRDNYWGGAPDKVESWYGHFINALRENNWSEAVWAAGVLSHYYTDPIQPFHTGQSEAENSIHRAAEWSINRSYDALRARGEAENPDLKVTAGAGDRWLRDFVCAGADQSNPYYEKLIAHYNLERGVVDPPAGLDELSCRILSKLVVYAAKGFSVILDRAFAEAAVSPPEVDLTLDTIMAAIKIPVKALEKKLADAEDRKIVQAMYDELKATGKVDATLPEDDKVVRNAYEAEVLKPRAEALAQARAKVVDAKKVVSKREPSAAPVAEPPALAKGTQASVKPAPEPVRLEAAAQAVKPQRAYLALTDNVEKGPSIGPKMAERLLAVGIDTVEQLLAADPAKVAADLGDRHVTAEDVTDWKDQARLMVEVPGLRGGQAQLLTGAGFRSRADLSGASAADVSARVLAYASSSEGKRLLRDGAVPDLQRIEEWVSIARKALAA